jgi:hypothetical protein
MRKIERHNKKTKRFSMVFPILTIIGMGILFAFSSFYEKSLSFNWNGIRNQIKDSVQIAEYGGISTGVVGYDGRKPKHFDRRHWIMQNATESELIKLTEYPNGTVKTIAYEGLMRKEKFEKKFDFILKAIADTEFTIILQAGCSGTEMNISEYLIDFVLYIDDKSPPPPIELKIPFKISEKERVKILKEYRKVPSLWK